MSDYKYPEGKLNEEDEGFLMVKVGVEKGKVRIDFQEATTWFAMNPDMAIDMAAMIITRAREAGSKKPLIHLKVKLD